MDYGLAWQILGGVIIVVAAFVATRIQTSNNSKMQEKANEHIEKIIKRLDKHGDDIIELKTKSELSMTAKDVDDKYVSKELFRQFEKHIDKRFDGVEEGQGKILNYIKEKR